MKPLRVLVVGSGIVGLAVAYHLVKAGATVEVVDRDPDGDRASHGNAGGIAVTEVIPAATPQVWRRLLPWMLDPLGPLTVRPVHAVRLIPWFARFKHAASETELARITRALAALNARVYDDLVPMLEDVGLRGHLHRSGALTVYETAHGFGRDAAEWESKRSFGIEATELSGDEAREMEPALGSLVSRAVFTPQWSHISDPKRLVIALCAWLRGCNVPIVSGEVMGIERRTDSGVGLRLAGGAKTPEADYVVIAAGAWSGGLARGVGDPVLLESERGYNSTLPEPGVRVGRQLIFAERKFVATPLSVGLRIGGAAEFGGLRAMPNYRRAHALVESARRFLPNLRTDGAVSWAGHRPATPDGLPVIGESHRHPRVLYAFGHGHLGLTQAATTGRLIVERLFGRSTAIDLAPYGIDRFRKQEN